MILKRRAPPSIAVTPRRSRKAGFHRSMNDGNMESPCACRSTGIRDEIERTVYNFARISRIIYGECRNLLFLSLSLSLSFSLCVVISRKESLRSQVTCRMYRSSLVDFALDGEANKRKHGRTLLARALASSQRNEFRNFPQGIELVGHNVHNVLATDRPTERCALRSLLVRLRMRARNFPTE